MDKNFTKQRVDAWLDWVGEPMLYDGGLYVNRTAEEHAASKVLRA